MPTVIRRSERGPITVDVMTEDGSEGHDPADLETEENPRFGENMSVAESIVITMIRTGSTDEIVWPRHYAGPQTSRVFVEVRRRLAERGAIVFDGYYWRLAPSTISTVG